MQYVRAKSGNVDDDHQPRPNRSESPAALQVVAKLPDTLVDRDIQRSPRLRPHFRVLSESVAKLETEHGLDERPTVLVVRPFAGGPCQVARYMESPRQHRYPTVIHPGLQRRPGRYVGPAPVGPDSLVALQAREQCCLLRATCRGRRDRRQSQQQADERCRKPLICNVSHAVARESSRNPDIFD